MKVYIYLFSLFLCCGNTEKFSIQENPARTVVINITGIIIDSESLSPVSAAVIYDSKNTRLGVTDKAGFFKASVTVNVVDDVKFGLIIKKPGYELFSQNEHWAAFNSPLSATYYFALKKVKSNSPSFSEFVSGENSADQIFAGLDKIKDKLEFEKKIAKRKAGNENIFFQIDSDNYLISNSGWLKLTSQTDTVVINGHQQIAASDINSYITRSAIKRMSPSSTRERYFEIKTD